MQRGGRIIAPRSWIVALGSRLFYDPNEADGRGLSYVLKTEPNKEIAESRGS